MSRKLSLPALLKKLYAENSRFDLGPPVQILKELENNILVLSDTEISDEDVPVLCRFFNHPDPCKLIKRIQVDRTSSKKAFVRRYDSAFTANGCRLLKELFKFIGNAKALQCVCFESTEIPIETLPLLGKSLTSSASPITWLGFRDCVFGGDEGLRVLTHYIGKLNLQVLALEQCQLTDASTVYIASILKAQQNNLDSLYWNATLRVDPGQRGSLWNASEIDAVYRCGLVALSLYGNLFEGKDMYALTRVLRNNHWLLGLNLANNQLARESVLVLTEELFNNTVLQTVLLKDNPGLDERVSGLLYAAIQRNTEDYTTDVTREVVEDLAVRHSSGFRRLELQSPRIALLLHTWQQLQFDETITPQLANSSFSRVGRASTVSAATTLGSGSQLTSISVRARRGIIAAAAAKESAAAVKLRGKSKGTKEAARASTRLAFEESRYANQEKPYGYSVLDLVPDKAPESPNASPYRQARSPHRAKSPNSFFDSFIANSFSGRSKNAREPYEKSVRDSNSQAVHKSFSTSQSRVDSEGPTSRFNMGDFQQPYFGDGASDVGDSIQLSMGSRDDIGLEDRSVEGPDAASDDVSNDPAHSTDFLDRAIPTVSPVAATRNAANDYYIGMNRASPGDRLLAQLRAHAKNDLYDLEVKAEGWGNIEWPLADDAVAETEGHDDSDGRPPSRISIRHRVDSHSQSPSPTSAARIMLDQEYLRLKEIVEQSNAAEAAAARRPPRSSAPTRRRASPAAARPQHSQKSSVNRLSVTASLPEYMQPISSSLSGWVSNRHPTRPFYAGGSLPGAASPPKHNSTRAKQELAQLYGFSSSAYTNSSTMLPIPDYLSHKKTVSATKGKKTRVSSAGRSRKLAAAEPTMGRAQGPRGTRIRARSADRAARHVAPPHHHARQHAEHHHHQQHQLPVYSRHPTPLGERPQERSASSPTSAQFMADLSNTVLTATRNMEVVSTKLKDVIETLSTSMDMNFSMQRDLQSASLLNASLLNSSRGAWDRPDATPAQSVQRSTFRVAHGTPSPAPLGSSSAQRYREHSSSPLIFDAHATPAAYGRHPDEHRNGHSNRHESTQASQPNADDVEEDAELTELVKSRLELKLRSMLEG